MPHPIRQELRPVLEAIAIVSPAAIIFRGETIAVTPGPVQPIPGVPAHPLPQMPLERELQALLYARCYSHRFEDIAPLPPYSSDPTYVQRLAAANRSQARFESGWTVYTAAPNGLVYLQKGDRQRTAQPGEYLTSGPPGMPPQQGSMVTVSAPRDSAIAQPGFYFLYGETLSDIWDEHHLLRFYFHATAESAPALLEYLTAELNRFQTPFRMKALIEPAMYTRTDAVVLYLARRHQQIAIRIMQRMPGEIGARLRPATPLFTLPLAPGIGLAEEPNTGESFGMHRCRLVAQALVEAWKAGDQSVAGRLTAIAAHFTRAGFNLDLPYLSPTSTDLEPPVAAVEFAYA
jgi:HopA1 effector protein family